MTKPAIAASRALPDALAGALRERYELREPAGADDATRAAFLARAEGVEALFATAFDAMDAAFIAALPASVRFIASYGVGVDHIDLAAAKGKGIAVSNTPEVSTPCLADLTFGLILAACRRFREGLDITRTGEGRGMLAPDEWGVRVSGKTLGIVGMGNVGRAVARRARGFDMKILYTTPRPSAEIDREYGAQSAPFEDLLARADIISLHCPLTDATRNLINAAAIAKMKQGAVLVNISRGPLVDETALINALKSGKLFAAGLDVFETEPQPIREDLRALSNVYCLPHIASATFESRIDMAMRLIANIDAWFGTGAPLDSVA